MRIDKLFIKNRKDQKIAVLLEHAEPQSGLAFVVHGIGGNREEKQLKVFGEAFLKNGYTVIRYDSTNTIGESDGGYENATVTAEYEDLEDVIEWAKSQKWYQEPFCLAGHSGGAISSILYAEENPKEVKALAPISAPISGKFVVEAYKKHGDKWFEELESTGRLISESQSKPGLIKELNWHQFKEDILKYDVLPRIGKLTMPVLMIVGENDWVTPLKYHEVLYKKLSCQKEMHVIKNAPHTFVEDEHLREVQKIFLDWLDTI